jgi:hypothetical protein
MTDLIADPAQLLVTNATLLALLSSSLLPSLRLLLLFTSNIACIVFSLTHLSALGVARARGSACERAQTPVRRTTLHRAAAPLRLAPRTAVGGPAGQPELACSPAIAPRSRLTIAYLPLPLSFSFTFSIANMPVTLSRLLFLSHLRPVLAGITAAFASTASCAFVVPAATATATATPAQRSAGAASARAASATSGRIGTRRSGTRRGAQRRPTGRTLHPTVGRPSAARLTTAPPVIPLGRRPANTTHTTRAAACISCV